MHRKPVRGGRGRHGVGLRRRYSAGENLTFSSMLYESMGYKPCYIRGSVACYKSEDEAKNELRLARIAARLRRDWPTPRPLHRIKSQRAESIVL